jgi:hypothetical protein
MLVDHLPLAADRSRRKFRRWQEPAAFFLGSLPTSRGSTIGRINTSGADKATSFEELLLLNFINGSGQQTRFAGIGS